MTPINRRFIVIRDQMPGDEPFFFSTYLKNNWYSKENTTTLNKQTWQKAQRYRLQNILKHQSIQVACLNSDPDVILGYGFWDETKAFIYIKQAWRDEKFGIKEALNQILEERR